MILERARPLTVFPGQRPVDQVVMMPPNTNRSRSFPGDPVRVGRHRFTAPTCREAVVDALDALLLRTGGDTFTVRQVHAEILAAGARYAESTTFKTMQRMKQEPARPPFARLERVGRAGFRVVDAGQRCGAADEPTTAALGR